MGKFSILAMGLAVMIMAAPASALYDVIVDDSDAQFLDWDGNLLTSATGGYNNGGYRYVNNWGTSGPASARVRYYLPNIPSGERLYHVYAYSPSANSSQWHPLNVAADGTENFAQQISWAGQFGTNKQWIAFDAQNQGGWVQLGPGPQTDASLGGQQVYITGDHGQPYLYVEYQGYFNNPIAFDAIRVVEVPEPASLAGMGLMGLMVLRRRRK